jgi:hypothetical protein
VLDAELQSNPIVLMVMLQLGLGLDG